MNFKEINLKPIINRNNHQINFSLKKNSLPKDIKDMLPKLKTIKLRIEDFEFE